MTLREQTFSPLPDIPAPPKRLGILGGTFNPPHLGHLRMAEIARREFSLGDVLVLPVGDPPHKRDMLVAQREYRRAMGMLFCEEHPWLIFSDMELDREGYTYTVDTLTQLAAESPDTVFYYIIGTDTLFQLPTWRNWPKVRTLTHFVCIPRPGDDPARIQAQAEALFSEGAHIHMAREMCLPISSTMVREERAKGGSGQDLVPRRIFEFLESNHVYRQQPSP